MQKPSETATQRRQRVEIRLKNTLSIQWRYYLVRTSKVVSYNEESEAYTM